MITHKVKNFDLFFYRGHSKVFLWSQAICSGWRQDNMTSVTHIYQSLCETTPNFQHFSFLTDG